MMITRNDFRCLFGLKVSHKCGHFIDRCLSKEIGKYSDWLDYPDGNLVLRKHTGEVNAAAVSDDGCYLYSGGKDKCIVEWDLVKATVNREWIAHNNSVFCLVYYGGFVISGSIFSIKVWNPENGALLRTLRGHTDVVRAVDVSAKDTGLIVSGSQDMTVRLWSLKSGECIGVLNSHTDEVRSVLLIGSLVISGSLDQSLKITHTQDGVMDQKTISDGITKGVRDLALNCDESLLACMIGFRGCVVYRWPSMEVSRTLRVKSNHGCFHPSQPHILAVDGRGDTVQLINVESAKVIRTWSDHTDSAHCLRFTPDGTRVISVSEDETVRVWDVTESE